jgi:hypothetical protein
MNNTNGLDANYFKGKFALVMAGINNYTPPELARELARLAKTADDIAAAEVTHPQTQVNKSSSLLREPISAANPLSAGCYCKEGKCGAPHPSWCRDTKKRDGISSPDTLSPHPPAQPDTAALKARIAELEKSDAMWDDEIKMRDNYHDWADKLAGAIASHFGCDIGEHSSANNPWAEALDTIENAPEQLAAQAGQAQIYPACKGMNCSATDGRSHSTECIAEHDACVSGKTKNIDTPKVWYSNYSEDELANLLATKIPASSNRIAWRGAYYKLLLPCDPNPTAIVQAALEAAAKSTMKYEFTFVGGGIANEIRAIDPQSVIDSMEGK